MLSLSKHLFSDAYKLPFDRLRTNGVGSLKMSATNPAQP
jgi:hypothetical protein